MKSDPSEYKAIIEKLIEKTRQRRVEWREDLGRHSFSCTLANGTATPASIIARPGSDKAIEGFSFAISSYDSQVVLVMKDGTDCEIFRVVANDLPTSPEEEDVFLLLEELHELARRQALRVEQKLELASSLLDRA